MKKVSQNPSPPFTHQNPRLGQIGGQDASGLRVFLIRREYTAKLLFTAWKRNIPIICFLFPHLLHLTPRCRDRLVADIYDGPGPRYDSSETET